MGRRGARRDPAQARRVSRRPPYGRTQPRRRPRQPHLLLGEYGAGQGRRAERRAGGRDRAGVWGSGRLQASVHGRLGQPLRLGLGLARAGRPNAQSDLHSRPGFAALIRADAASNLRCLGARLLPEVPEPPSRLRRRLEERRQLGQGRRATERLSWRFETDKQTRASPGSTRARPWSSKTRRLAAPARERYFDTKPARCRAFLACAGRYCGTTPRAGFSERQAKRSTPSPGRARQARCVVLGRTRSCVGPHPYPEIVREMQAVIGRESRKQILEREGRLPEAVIACVGGGSNSIGMFAGFLDDAEVKLYGVEAAGAASLGSGRIAVLHGARSLVLADEDGQIADGVIVGSRAIEVAEGGAEELCRYVASLRAAIDTA